MTIIWWSPCNCKPSQLLQYTCPHPKTHALVIPQSRGLVGRKEVWRWHPWPPAHPFHNKEPEHPRLCFYPQGNGQLWQDVRQCCSAVVPALLCFLGGYKSSGDSFAGSIWVINSLLFLCFFFFLVFFFLRESARGRREGEMSYKGCNILFCRAWFVIALAIKRKTMFVYCCS